jgi:hypothetical protein
MSDIEKFKICAPVRFSADFTLYDLYQNCCQWFSKPVVLEPAVLEPVVIEHVVLEPVVLEPVVLEPAVIEPETVALEPVVVEPVVIDPVVCCRGIREKRVSFEF